MPRRMSPEEVGWLRENYAQGTIHDTADSFEERFGWHPSIRTLYVRAHKLGLRKELQDPRIRTARAQVRISWSHEPEMEAWMLEHDRGERIQSLIDAFEERFGIRLSRAQVSSFRATHGTQKRDVGCARRGGRPRRPIGYERETKGGILVKVSEEATVPMSKDNWRFKHHLAYEEAYGEIPEGCQVFAVDGDSRNCDPSNLVAVPQRLVAVLSRRHWGSREELLAQVSLAGLEVGIADAESRKERRCEVCGAKFRETPKQRRYGMRIKTCPACIAAGRRAKGDRGDKKPMKCAICGATFLRETRSQRRCRRCIGEAPTLSVVQHRKRRSKGA